MIERMRVKTIPLGRCPFAPKKVQG